MDRTYSGAELSGWFIKIFDKTTEWNCDLQKVHPPAFSRSSTCSATDGVCFCRAEDAGVRLRDGLFYRTVAVSDDAKVVALKRPYAHIKADKVTLGDEIPLFTCERLFNCLVDAGRLNTLHFSSHFYTMAVWEKIVESETEESDAMLVDFGYVFVGMQKSALDNVKPKLLIKAASRGHLHTCFKSFRTREMMMAAIYGRNCTVDDIERYFPSDWIDDTMKSAMIPMGFPPQDVSAAHRTLAVLDIFAQSSSITRSAMQFFDSTLFTPDIYEHLASNLAFPIEYVPAEFRTQRALERIVFQKIHRKSHSMGNSIVSRAHSFPPSAFSQSIYERLDALDYPIENVPVAFRTRAMFDGVLARGDFYKLAYFDDAFCDSDAVACLCRYLTDNKAMAMVDCPGALLMFDVFCVLLDTRDWYNVQFFIEYHFKTPYQTNKFYSRIEKIRHVQYTDGDPALYASGITKKGIYSVK